MFLQRVEVETDSQTGDKTTFRLLTERRLVLQRKGGRSVESWKIRAERRIDLTPTFTTSHIDLVLSI